MNGQRDDDARYQAFGQWAAQGAKLAYEWLHPPKGADAEDADSDGPIEEKGATPTSTMTKQFILNELAKRIEPSQIDTDKLLARIEQHGADAWLALMNHWEQAERAIIDEMMTTTKAEHGEKPSKAREYMDLADNLAKKLTERVVNRMMESPKQRRKRRWRRPHTNDEP